MIKFFQRYNFKTSLKFAKLKIGHSPLTPFTMHKCQKISLFLLRLGFGWLFLYAGLTKVMNPEWSAAGYLESAKTFSGFYQWLASDAILPITNFLNEWGQIALGVSLILGLFTRLSGYLGALMMALYYLPALDFPYPNAHSFIVDEHILYGLALIYMAEAKAGNIWGLNPWCAKLPLCKKFPKLRAWLG